MRCGACLVLVGVLHEDEYAETGNGLGAGDRCRSSKKQDDGDGDEMRCDGRVGSVPWWRLVETGQIVAGSVEGEILLEPVWMSGCLHFLHFLHFRYLEYVHRNGRDFTLQEKHRSNNLLFNHHDDHSQPPSPQNSIVHRIAYNILLFYIVLYVCTTQLPLPPSIYNSPLTYLSRPLVLYTIVVLGPDCALGRQRRLLVTQIL